MTSDRSSASDDRRSSSRSAGGRAIQIVVVAALLALVGFAQVHAREQGPGEGAARAFAAALAERDVAALTRLLDDGVAVSTTDSQGRALTFAGEAQAITYLDAWRLSGGDRGALRLNIENGRVTAIEVGPDAPKLHADLGGF